MFLTKTNFRRKKQNFIQTSHWKLRPLWSLPLTLQTHFFGHHKWNLYSVLKIKHLYQRTERDGVFCLTFHSCECYMKTGHILFHALASLALRRNFCRNSFRYSIYAGRKKILLSVNWFQEPLAIFNEISIPIYLRRNFWKNFCIFSLKYFLCW